ncbi:hypothetical protein V6N13_069872 [Hibiscus sabdariffa]|uniref:Uncharacterized protein n=1 Tax=Hibiscus sabdariffa TaxID=183260 RepID=A0ABR2BIZ1_9ROSI
MPACDSEDEGYLGETWSMVLIRGWCQSLVGSEVFDGCSIDERGRVVLGGRDSMREMNDGDVSVKGEVSKMEEWLSNGRLEWC